MANPLPSVAHPIAMPRSGTITRPWLLFLSGLISDQGNAITWSTVSSGVGFQNGWVDVDPVNRPAQYGTDGTGRVYLRGVISTGTIGLVAFTLPAALAPIGNRRFAVDSNAAFGSCKVGSDGTVTPAAGSNASFFLDGILFFTT